MSGYSLEEFTDEQLARLFDVPPWFLNRSYPRPRFPRLRWCFRHIWPI